MPTIARQLFHSVVPGILFTLLTGGVLLDLMIAERLEEEFDQQLITRTQALMALTEEEEGVVEVESHDEAMPGYSRKEAPDYFTLHDAEGQLLLSSPSVIGDSALPHPGDASDARPDSTFLDLTLPDGRPGRLLRRTFIPTLDVDDDEDEDEIHDGGGNDEVPIDASPASERTPVTLQVAISRDRLDGLLSSVHLVLVVTGLALMGVIVLLTRSGIRRTVAPLERISEQVAGLDERRLDERLVLDASVHELDVLTSRFNALLTRLDRAFERERCFSGDVAHELRTPLAELRSMIEVTERFPDDPTLRGGFFTDLKASTQRMQRTVENLLALSRSETGQACAGVRLDLRLALERAVGERREAAAQRDCTFALTLPPEPLSVPGDAFWTPIISNLLDNATAHGDAGTEITVSLTHDGRNGQLRFAVSNSARELVPEDTCLMFDRLWRKDRSRASSLHSGLGLALVKVCATQLGLSAGAALESGQRLTVYVEGVPEAKPAVSEGTQFDSRDARDLSSTRRPVAVDTAGTTVPGSLSAR